MLEKYEGCLLGLALGDALGAPVEFLSLAAIRERYGEAGLTTLEGWDSLPPGSYTDDTQMALATAVGVTRARQRWLNRGICNDSVVIYHRYLAWFKTQEDPVQRRAPGNTCLSALGSGNMGTIDCPINNSKGCGGVMRTAPAGLALPPGSAFKAGADYAAITHGHPSGYLSAGFMAELISRIITGEALLQAITGSVEKLRDHKGHEETLEKIELARALVQDNTPPTAAIKRIGAGWVGEEALAIGLYCGLKHPTDWTTAVLAAVNHSGDSDSTGSIAGAILGTSLGCGAIPGSWLAKLENAAAIKRLARDMHRAFVLDEPLSFEEYPPN